MGSVRQPSPGPTAKGEMRRFQPFAGVGIEPPVSASTETEIDR